MKSLHQTREPASRNRSWRQQISVLLLACATIGIGHAQSTYYWVGRDTSPTFFGAYWSYNNNFSTSSGGSGLGSPGIPSLQNYLNFDGAAVGGFTSTNDFATNSAGFQIYFKSGAPAYSLYGNPIVFYNFGANNPNIQNEGVTSQTIHFPIVDGNSSGANGILNININPGGAGPLVFNGAISALDAAVATRAINVSNTAAVTFNGVISDFSPSGKIALTQLGANTITLTSSNTYSGQTTLASGGTLNLNHAAAPGSGTVALNGSATIDNTSGAAITLANNNALTLSGGSLTFAGTTNLNFGTGTVTISGANRTVTVSSNTLTLGGGVTDAGGTRKLTKAGAGTLVLNAAAGTWTGGSSIDAGTLTIGTDTTLGTGNMALNGGTLTAGNGARVLANSATLTASSIIGGANNLTLNGVFTNSGGSRTLTVLNTGTTTLGGSVFLSDDNTTTSRAMTITNVGPVVISGSISNNNAGNTVAAGLTYTGTNTLTLSGANNFSGAATISGGTVIAASTNAFSTTSTVTFAGTTGTTILDIQTDGNDVAFPVTFGSTTVGSTIASDVKTGSVGINHTLGSLTTGNSTLNIVKGINVASGSPAITFGTVSLSAGTAGTTIVNPTTASLSLGAVSIASGSNPKTLQLDGTNANNTITGVIVNNLNVLTIVKTNSGTWTLSNSGNSYSGNTSVGGSGTLNLTGGSGVTNGLFVNSGGTLTLSGTFGANAVTANNFIIGQTSGRGVLNILSGATVPRVNLFVGDGAAGDGAVYQSGGTVTLSQAAGIDNLRVGSTTGGKGYYRLTGGSVTAVRPAIAASLPDTIGVFDMTNGTLTSTEQLHITAGSATSSGLLNVMGGTVSAGTDIRMFTLAAGTAGATQQAILNVGGGTGAASVTTANTATTGLNMAQTANIAGEVGVVNLLANGTLTTSRILGTQPNPTLHFNFNGGKLKANTAVANPLFNDGGVDAINVYSSGGTIDNSGVAITLGSPLRTPTGTGVTSITGPSTQGSNYIGAPLVLITGGTGSGATAYAVMADDGSGKTLKVASIVVTSPGLYTVAPTTVTLLGGGAGTAASGFTINTAANTSGGMTFMGSGATTLSGTNTYTGATAVSAGELLGTTPGNLSGSAITVAGGATNGVSLGAAGSQWSCSGLTYSAGSTYVDFNFNGFAPSTTTAPLLVNGNLTLTSTPNIIVRAAGATTVGQYPLIKYTGTLSGTPPSVALSLPSRMSATISNNVANNSIDLVVTVGNAVQWAVGNANWDINTTANWKNSGGTAVNYLDSDAVVLDDTASGASPITISLNAAVTPVGITANLTNKSYTISSNAPNATLLGSAPLVKNGTNTLQINTTNGLYSGPITINAGTFTMGGTATLGTSTIALNGGTIIVGGAGTLGSGNITMSNGTTLNLSSGSTSTFVGNAITVAAGATATNTAGALGSGISGYISSGDSTSTLVVIGGTSYSGAYQMFSNFTGTVQVNSGATLRFSSTTGGASFGGSNATFNVIGTLQPRDQAHNTYLGAVIGTGSLGGPQTQPSSSGTATYFIGSKNIDSTFGGTISDRGITNLTAVVKNGSANLTLTNNSTFSGAFTIASGGLFGLAGGSCSNTAMTVNSGATNGVNVTVPGLGWTCSNLTYAAGTESVVFAFGGNTPSTTVAPLRVQSNLTISGTLNIAVTGGSTTIPVGTYPLIAYGGTLTGTPASATLPNYIAGYVTNDTANKLIAIVVTNVAAPTPAIWVAGTGNWDYASLNWTNPVTGGALTAWTDTNGAVFDDSASGAGPFTVSLAGNVNPTGVTVSNIAKDYTFSGASITGFDGLAKLGAGTLTIANSNTFTGTTTIGGGTLAIGNGGTTGSLANMAIVDNGALVINRSDAVAISSVITGTGSFTNQGGGTTTVSVTNTYAGNTTVKAGTLQMTDSGNLNPASTLVLAGGQFTRASQNFTPVKSNAYKFGLAVNADSTVATTATTTRTVHFDSANITAVPGTTLLVTNAAATGTNHFKFYSGGFSYAGNIVLGGNGGNNMTFLESYNTNDTLPDQIFTGVISGQGKIYKNIEGSSPGGNLILSNSANSYSGATELRAGYIGLGADNPLSTNRIVFGWDFNPLGFYAVDAPRTLANDIYADANSASASTAAGCTNLTIKGSQNLTLSGRILIATNIQFFTVNNSAVTTFSGIISNAAASSLGVAKQGSGALVFSGANAYSGDTFVNAGILRLGASGVIPDGAGKGNLSVAATLDLNTFSETVNSLNGAGIVDTVAGGTPALTVGNNNTSGSFSGVIQNTAGSLAFTKTGSGTQTLGGANTYSGNTVVSSGTLALGAAGSIANTPSIAVSTGALLDVSAVTGGFTLGAAQTLSGFGSVKGSITNNGVIAPGASIGTLTFSNSPVLNGTVFMELNRTNAQNADKLVLTVGTLNYGGALVITNIGDSLTNGDTFVLFSAAVYAGGFTNILLPALDPSLVWNTNNLAINGSISVALSISPSALELTSSANPSGFLDTLTFTATVTPTNATGSVTFYNGATPISTNTMTLGVATSASISSLARGTNPITATYLGDVNYYGSTNTLDQVVTNHPPVATLAGYYRGAVPTWKIRLTDIVTNIADADSDIITVSSLGTSTNGVTLTTGSGFVFYANANLVNDQFTYTVNDGYGGSTTGTVNLTAQAFITGQSGAVTPGGGSATVNFAGIPGFSYTAQRSTNLVDWAGILTTNAPVNGLFNVVDDFSDLGVVPGSAYYRLQYNP